MAKSRLFLLLVGALGGGGGVQLQFSTKYICRAMWTPVPLSGSERRAKEGDPG